MPKSSPELAQSRRSEIIEACKELYQTKSFREITIKDIGEVTSFTRTSIYNYFQTKEEIFLAMHQQEYELWCDELQLILETHPHMETKTFADVLAKSISHRELLLKLMSMNHFDMEDNSRPEFLLEFKKAYGQSLNLVTQCLNKFYPDYGEQRIQNFIYTFFPFLFGIYPYTKVTEKQKIAIKGAGIDFVYQSIYEIAYRCIVSLL